MGFDLTPFGFLLSAGVFTVTLNLGRFLDISPVARRTAMAEMNDAMVTLDGQQRQFSVSISQVTEHSSEARVVLLHDITAQNRRQQELQRQNERLDKFASVVSHDLQNPLGIAQMYLNFVEESAERDDFEAVREAHDRMDTMIDELLMMARADTLVDEPEPIALDSLASKAWTTSQTDGGTLETAIEDGTTIHGDPDLLQHVFENLFRNAVDHNTPPVTVTVGLAAGRSDGFYIEDDGSGIPADKRADVFDHGYSTSEEGTGFGLSIVSDLIGAHGWEVAVTKSEAGGARFEITGVEITGVEPEAE